jgi:hypothetical protein
MKMREVGGSSAIAAVGHDPDSHTLHVRFHSGRTYAYSKVSAAAHSRLMSADSMGAHFSQHIRPLGGVEVKEPLT